MNLINQIVEQVSGNFKTLRIKCNNEQDAELLCQAFRKSISANNGYTIITIEGHTIAEKWTTELRLRARLYRDLMNELKHHDKTIVLCGGIDYADGKLVDFDFGAKK
jgi:hypothetical protein